MKIALIHDYITSFGGAEKTFKTLIQTFDEAKVYTLFYDPEVKEKFFSKTKIRTSFLQKFPKVLKKNYKFLLPFLPIAAESIDLGEFDLVISSSFSFVKGVITKPKTMHICYCYTPTRYLWLDEKKQKGIIWKNPISKILLHHLRIWDRQASERVDKFIAISNIVKKRIKKYYKKNSDVIYPPIDLGNVKFPIRDTGPKNEFYLIVSQLRKYKRIDLAIETFNKLGLNLVIIGEGPEKKKLQRMAKNNIKILGWQPNKIVNKYYVNCAAFIFPAEEDFGMAPVEAMAFGKPVLAFNKGGARETIIEKETGEFFTWQNIAVLADGVRRIRANLPKYNSQKIRAHAQKFSRKRFEREFKEYINK